MIFRKKKHIKKPQILLLEDDPVIAMVEIKLMENNGCDVIHKTFCEDAIDLIKKKSIDLIVLDFEFGNGKMTGFDFKHLIQKEIPTILVSGSDFTQPNNQHFDVYIDKINSFYYLNNKINELLKISE